MSIWPPGITGPDGRFQLQLDVSSGVVHLYPDKEGYLHPCMTSSRVSADLSLEIELVQNPVLRPVHPVPQTLTGLVVDPKLKPIAGAVVIGSWFGEFPELWTLTDQDGRYFFCGLSEGFFREGSVSASTRDDGVIHKFQRDGMPASQGSGDRVLDLQMRGP